MRQQLHASGLAIQDVGATGLNTDITHRTHDSVHVVRHVRHRGPGRHHTYGPLPTDV